MKYRKFKDIELSEVGLGTWQLGSADWGELNEDRSLAILQEFADLGGTFIDTADVYGMGISEKVIGKFLAGSSKQLYVASKLGRRQDGANGWPQNFDISLMRRHIENSLEHLGLPRLFLSQLHCIPTDEMRSGKVFDNLRKLKQEGLIDHFGASVETTDEALICLEEEGLSSLQLIFNLFRQHVAEELFEKAAQKDVALIIRVPLASGLLSGKFNENTVFAEKDHRNYNADGAHFNAGETFSGVEFSRGVAVARRMAALMPDDRTSQWAIRWILDHPQVTTVIPGASGISQVKGNMNASALSELPADVSQALRTIYDEEVYPFIRGHF